MAKKVNLGNLMHRPAGSTPLPGVHGRQTEASKPEEVVQEEKSTEQTPAEVEPAPAKEPEKPTEEAPEEEPETPPETPDAEPETPAKEPKPAQPKASAPTKAKPKTRKKSARKGQTAMDLANKNAEGELEGIDGRPARLWDLSTGEALPDGWARIAIDQVAINTRKFDTDRRSAPLPDNVYQACSNFIYQELMDGGRNLTLSVLGEAAFEQIPFESPAGIQRLLDGLPEQYFDRGLTPRPRTFQLIEPTLQQMKTLAAMLRAQGHSGKTGLVQIAVLRELLMDLGVDVDQAV